jgi:hypothetical protein
VFRDHRQERDQPHLAAVAQFLSQHLDPRTSISRWSTPPWCCDRWKEPGQS